MLNLTFNNRLSKVAGPYIYIIYFIIVKLFIDLFKSLNLVFNNCTVTGKIVQAINNSFYFTCGILIYTYFRIIGRGQDVAI